ncbi:MAG: helix-turn-helix domain-containing protein [Actinoplanes sp.]
MSLTSPMGDQPISDPQAMRALAHPVRLAVLSYLQRTGPATATQLSPHVGATPSVVSWHLRHLASFGLVADADPDEVPGDRRQRWWKAAARGFRIELGEGPEAEAAVRVLGRQLFDTARQQTDEWLAGPAQRLDLTWLRAAGISNTQVRLTTAEVSELNAKIEELLGAYVLRPEQDVPEGARDIRILRYVLPSESE